ncbi:MAG: hypothetical protein JXR96_20800 [Deltaproteobacteria bacterium]|nr:hypothetical protein [Deltaproteobacteria bacterium]
MLNYHFSLHAFHHQPQLSIEEDGALESDGESRPILFSKLGIKKWLATWERRLADRIFYPPRGARLSLRDIVGAQAYRLARHFGGRQAYEAFVAAG